MEVDAGFLGEGDGEFGGFGSAGLALGEGEVKMDRADELTGGALESAV